MHRCPLALATNPTIALLVVTESVTEKAVAPAVSEWFTQSDDKALAVPAQTVGVKDNVLCFVTFKT